MSPFFTDGLIQNTELVFLPFSGVSSDTNSLNSPPRPIPRGLVLQQRALRHVAVDRRRRQSSHAHLSPFLGETRVRW